MAPVAGDWIDGFLERERLPQSYRAMVETVVADLVVWIEAERRAGQTFYLGLCGPQASGKSTLAAALARTLEVQGRSVAVLSLDDLYLSRNAREHLAARVHELFVTRGPPGTHDLPLGHAVFDQLRQPGSVTLPRFSKADDEPEPRSRWPELATPVDIVLFEGWCVGARPQTPEALSAPVNALEAERDPAGLWRGHVNAQLAGPYAAFFARLDRLIYLMPPSFEVVTRWRQEQEAKLRHRRKQEGLPAGRTMDDPAVARFVQHYERLTRAMLADLPAKADLTLRLSADRQVAASPRR